MSLNEYHPTKKFFEDEWSVFDPEFAAIVHADGSIMERNCKGTQTFASLLTTDLIESQTDFHVYADLPDMDIKDIDVCIEGNSLIIAAERKNVHEYGKVTIHNVDGKVTRSLRIPRNVDIENVEPVFRNGVLTVSFPKIPVASTSSKKLIVRSSF